MKATSFLIIIIIACSNCWGQFIDNSKGDAFTTVPFFNAEFVKSSRLKSIKGTISIKKQNDMFREQKGHFAYYFNEKGQIITIEEIHQFGAKIDTLKQFYSYDALGHLICHKTVSHGATLSTYYQYNEAGWVISLEKYNESSTSLTEEGDKNLLLKEHLEYQKTDSLLVKKKFNNYGLPYSTETFSYSKDGYLLESNEQLKMVGTRYNKHYSYNEKGLLSSISSFYNDDNDAYEELCFSYDLYGNLSAKHLMSMGQLTKEIQVIYDEKNYLFSYIIYHDPSNGSMELIKFESPIKFQ